VAPIRDYRTALRLLTLRDLDRLAQRQLGGIVHEVLHLDHSVQPSPQILRFILAHDLAYIVASLRTAPIV